MCVKESGKAQRGITTLQLLVQKLMEIIK